MTKQAVNKSVVKLYDLPRDNGIRIKMETSDKEGKLGDFVIFHHIDGMYSYCTVEGREDVGPIHLSASTELTLSKDGDYYETV